MVGRKSVRARRWSLVLGSSIAAVVAASASPAWAQCSPDPTVAGEVTDCTGTDSDGLRVTTNDSTVQVASSASVAGSNGAAITIDIAPQPDTYEARTATIAVGGSVDGGAQSGITVLSGSVTTPYYFYGTYAYVTVGAGATVTGVTGITAEPSAGNAYGQALVSITNAGTISGTSGVALLAVDPARGGFETIDNAQGGTIGAIVGTVGQLTNAGLIDGGTLSAIDQTTTYNNWPTRDEWSNSGTIRSSSSAATIANLSNSFYPLTNSGTITNTGTGAAIQGGGLAITNSANGTISTAGETAIVATSLTLTNAGMIKGNVVAIRAYGTYFYNTIDSTQGTIEGDLTLGEGNDLVYGRYDGTATLVTGVTGTIDAGGGANSLVLAPSTDLTVSTAINLPTGFQRLRLAPDADTTLTLADGFVAPGTIELAGNGTLVNKAAITTQGQAFVAPCYANGDPSLINDGSIDATVGQYYYAVDLNFYGTLNNTGTITSSGNGVISGGAVSNSGVIVAANTALSQFNGLLDNSGTIRSTQGIGVNLSGNTNNTPAINSGLIEGATYGAVTGYVLNNSGTIAATGSGTAVGLEGYGVLNNLAGGIISGGAYAVTGHDPYGSTSVYNAAIYNAGTINGDVTFVSPRHAGYNNHNTFVALPGGVLNGNLTLGSGDTLVTDMVNTGPGQFAGINGTVTTTDGLLRYRVSGEASAVIGAVGPFATTGYELVDGARLTLTADTTQTLPLVLAGDGTVDLTADITATNEAALTVVAAAVVPGTVQNDTAGLTIVSRGTLSGTIDNYYLGAFGVVSLGANNTLQNEGTINAAYAATNGGYSFNAAVIYGDTLVNNGRIELNGSYGAYNVDEVVNTGTIIQTGSLTSYGIVDASSVTNSGTILTAGTAIRGDFGTVITNSGTITSTDSAAITSFYTNGQVINLVGGSIVGGNGTAIRGSGSVINAGTIIGDVDFSYGYGYGYGYGSVYYANGGTLTGNLTLGYGDDLLLLQAGDETGVSGSINAGGGRNVYGLALTASGMVAVGPAPISGFENAMVAAIGGDTVATVTGIDASFTNLYAAGDGTVINQSSLSGHVLVGNTSFSARTLLPETLGGFVNEGSIADGVSGSVAHFVNTGTIGSASLDDAAVLLYSRDAMLLENAGRIETGGENAIAIMLMGSFARSLSNSGTIVGATVFGGGADNVANSGTIGPVFLGNGDDSFRLLEGGLLTGVVNGGLGNDTATFELASGFTLSPDILTGFERLQAAGTGILNLAGGSFAFDEVDVAGQMRVASDASLAVDQITVNSGRLTGLAGSTITAPIINVASGAIFGSAGTVNGNIAVSGVLSPGASPGTMTVNGDISLAGSSVSVFEITPTVSDKLIVNGNLTITEGATLQIDASQGVTPGQSLDLIVADDITGNFTNIVKPASMFGLVVQRDGTIALLGQFENNSAFSPQVQSTVTYVNDVLTSGQATEAFLAAVPDLVTVSGTSDPAAFAQLTPEAYASAGQMAVEQSLEVANAGRSDAFATPYDTPGGFTFASMLGNTGTLEGTAQGTARARMNGYGGLGGIGWGSRNWSIGGFVGYLGSQQIVSQLGAKTEFETVVAGIHGRWTGGRLGVKATVAYTGSNAKTRRDLPGGSAQGRYDLAGWTGDLSVDYAIPLGSGWTVRPGLGATAVRTARDQVVEAGGSPYALNVAREHGYAVFVDGGLTFQGGMRDDAVVRPYLTLGTRHQIHGRSPIAVAALGGGEFSLVASGAPRASVLATASLGADAILTSRLVLFGAVSGEAGDANRRASARAGFRLAF